MLGRPLIGKQHRRGTDQLQVDALTVHILNPGRWIPAQRANRAKFLIADHHHAAAGLGVLEPRPIRSPETLGKIGPTLGKEMAVHIDDRHVSGCLKSWIRERERTPSLSAPTVKLPLPLWERAGVRGLCIIFSTGTAKDPSGRMSIPGCEYSLLSYSQLRPSQRNKFPQRVGSDRAWHSAGHPRMPFCPVRAVGLAAHGTSGSCVL